MYSCSCVPDHTGVNCETGTLSAKNFGAKYFGGKIFGGKNFGGKNFGGILTISGINFGRIYKNFGVVNLNRKTLQSSSFLQKQNKLIYHVVSVW